MIIILTIFSVALLTALIQLAVVMVAGNYSVRSIIQRFQSLAPLSDAPGAREQE